MTTPADPLVLQQAPERVSYALGELLNAGDFTAEQTYHRGRLARALVHLYGSGTVTGLRVVVEEAVPATPTTPAREETLKVQPGIALDRLGRLIEVPRPCCLRLNRWYLGHEAGNLSAALHGNPPDTAVVVDVFVRFIACERGKTPVFAMGPFEALDAVAAARLRDGYEVQLFPRKEATPPLPQNRWPNLAAIPDANTRRSALQNAILDAALDAVPNAAGTGTELRDTGLRDHGKLWPLREHLPGQDPSFVLLARLSLPADPAAANNRPARKAGAKVKVDNESRPFLYPGERWIGEIKTGPT